MMKMKTKVIKFLIKNNLRQLYTMLPKIESNPIFIELINKIKRISSIAKNGYGTMKMPSPIETFLIRLLDRDSKKDLSL